MAYKMKRMNILKEGEVVTTNESTTLMAKAPKHWGEKRYYSLDYYIRQTFGEKLYKLSLDGGMSCPNRDGTLGTGGCIFCGSLTP